MPSPAAQPRPAAQPASPTTASFAEPSARPTPAHAAAAVINAAAGVFNVVQSLPVMQGGAAKSTQIPYPVVILGFALAILGLVGSYGVWKRQRWGVVLTIVINVVSFIGGAPGILFGGTAFLVISSIVLCLINIVVIYLLLRRRSATPAVADRR